MNKLKISIAAGWLLLSASVSTSAQSTNYKTYSIFLFSFTKYINWPEESRNGEFVIAVYGNAKMLTELQASAAGRKVGNQMLRVVEARALSDLDGAQMVFIGETKSGNTDEIVKQFQDQPLLIVTERDGLIRKGACVSFVVGEDQSLKFQLNEMVLMQKRLKAASALVTLAYRGS